jgi:nitrogen-specific signal transduction histidine kinase
MNVAQLDLALSVIRLVSDSVQSRMKQHDELMDLFNTALEEGRDFTDAEVALWKTKAEEAISSLDDVIANL